MNILMQLDDMRPYLQSLQEALKFQSEFNKLGFDYAVMGIFVSLENKMDGERIIVCSLPLPLCDEKKLEFLGFDVSWGEPSFHSFIYQPGFLTKESEEVKHDWEKKLNQYGLLFSLEDVIEFRKECLKVITDTMQIMGVAHVAG